MEAGRNNVTKPEKKPFDKKKWREKKYSNKYKLQQWEERKKKAIVRNYYKELKKDNIVRNKSEGNQEGQNKQKRMSSFKAAQLKLKEIQEEKERQKQEKLKRKEDMKKALEQYKKNRTDKFKKLSRKTKTGQPLMKGRMEMLFEKIKGDTDLVNS